MKNYLSPKIEILKVIVEQGFIGSSNYPDSSNSGISGGIGGSENMGGDGDINVGW